MKKHLLTISILLISFGLNAQIIKIKATSLASKVKNKDDVWSDWSDWKDSDILITVDPDDNRIIIYSKTKQTLDIAENLGKTTDDEGNITMAWLCVDQDGYECRFRYFKNLKGSNQIYIDYNMFKVAYTVYTLN